MTVEAVAAGHYRRQQALGRRAADEAGRLWALIDPGAIRPSWLAQIRQVLAVVGSAQGIAAASAGVYVDDALQAQGVTAAAAGRIRMSSFAGIASDGRDLASLLYRPAVSALADIRGGVTVDRALNTAAAELDMIVRTQVADAGRAADGVAIAVRPAVGGYVRMLNPPSCSRCIILAGRHYKWNAGFQRHPRCDCRHIPASDNVAGDLRTNPKRAFNAMSAAEQDKAFTQSGAQAIRDGADIGRVVNARRGAFGLTPAGARITAAEAKALRNGRDVGRLETRRVYGQDLFVTTEAMTTRSTVGRRLGAGEAETKNVGQRYRTAKTPRLMPESIYQIAGSDRDEAVRLLRRFGYIT